MATEKTTNFGWDKPVFPSNDLATELDTLIDQIDAGVSGSGSSSWWVSDDGTQLLENPEDINFGTGLSATDDGDGSVTLNVANISENELSFDTATQTELDYHTLDSSAHHSRYTDTEAVAAINTESSLSVDITGDAATVGSKNPDNILVSTKPVLHPTYPTTSDAPTTQIGDVFHVDGEGLYVKTDAVDTIDNSDTPLQEHINDTSNPHNVSVPVQSVNGQTGDVVIEAKTQQVISMTTSSSQDVNSTTSVNWDEHIVYGDPAFSHNTGNSGVDIQETGTYRIYANLYTDSSNSRTNPSFRFRVNGNEIPGRSGSSYARDSSGHNDTSTNLEVVQELSSGDTVDVYTFREANSGSCNLQNRRSIFTIEKMAR